MSYVGRFAPSPSGPLHAGSLLAAVASWLDARAHNGRWLLRIEDIDTPRCNPEHAQRIIQTLAALGLEWDGPISYQSERLPLYETAFQQLKHQHAAFPCACSRKQLKREQSAVGEVVYPGTCRNGLPSGTSARTWRFRVKDQDESFLDRLFGEQQQNPAQQCGDFVIRRADQLFAYQLVVVVDDAEQQVTDIVRGVDLMPSTGRQLQLMRSLGYPAPAYLHLPLIRDADGYKLSKQNGAKEIPWESEPANCLNQALSRLGQPTQSGTISQMLEAAIADWDIGKIPKN